MSVLKHLFQGKKSIQMEFSESELKQLIELVFAGEWVLTYDIEINNPYDPLRNKIYSHAYEAGLTKQITHAPESGGYFETPRFEQPLLKKINRFVRAEQQN